MLFLQSFLQLLMLVGPGLLVWIWRSNRREASSGGPWIAMGISYLVVSLVLVCLEGSALPNMQAIANGVPLRIAAGALSACILLCTGHALMKNRVVRGRVVRSLPFEVSTLIVAHFVISLTIAELPGVPGSGYVTLGDVALYASATADRVENRLDHPSVWIADYVGGSVAYLKNHPLPVFAVSALSRCFGTPPLQAQNQFNLLPLTMSALIIGAALSRIGRKIAFWATMLILCAPSTAILSTNAAHVLPATLGFLLLSLSVTKQLQWTKNIRLMIGCLSATFLILHRPESAVFAISVIVSLVIIGLLRLFSNLGRKGALCGIVGTALLVVSFVLAEHLHAIFESLSYRYIQSLAISYAHWNPGEESFTTVRHFSSINKELMKGNLIQGYENKLINHDITRHIVDHPIEFIRYCFLQFVTVGLRALGQVFGGQLLMALGISLEWLFTGLLLLGLVTPPVTVLTLSVLLALLALPLANSGIEFRHAYLLWPALILYLSAVCSDANVFSFIASQRIIRRYQYIFWVGSASFLLAVPSYWLAYRIRMDERWVSHGKSAKVLERYLPPNSLVGASLPQVISSVSDFQVVGGTWLGRYLRFVERRFCPDALILTNVVNKNELLYSRKNHSRTLGRYGLVMHSRSPNYLILRRKVKCPARTRRRNRGS